MSKSTISRPQECVKPHVNNLITIYSHLSNGSKSHPDVVKAEVEWTNVCVEYVRERGFSFICRVEAGFFKKIRNILLYGWTSLLACCYIHVLFLRYQVTHGNLLRVTCRKKFPFLFYRVIYRKIYFWPVMTIFYWTNLSAVTHVVQPMY